MLISQQQARTLANDLAWSLFSLELKFFRIDIVYLEKNMGFIPSLLQLRRLHCLFITEIPSCSDILWSKNLILDTIIFMLGPSASLSGDWIWNTKRAIFWIKQNWAIIYTSNSLPWVVNSKWLPVGNCLCVCSYL